MSDLDGLMLDWAKGIAMPMSLVDGRPWVPTEAEACPCLPGAPEHRHNEGGYR